MSNPSCIFCDSNYHVTLNCDIYISNESRRKRARSKNFCEYCLNSVPCKPSPYRIVRTLCLFNLKCFLCFTEKSHHHYVFCPERDKVPKMFLPNNIDKILLSRFFKFCNAAEKYTMILGIPEVLSYVKLQPLKILKSLKLGESRYKFIQEENIVVTNDIELYDCHLDVTDNNIFLQNIIVRAIYVNISRTTLSSQELFHLLSAKVNSLICWRLTLTSKATFKEIIKRCPNIQDLQLLKNTDILIENSWPKDLLNYQTGGSFDKLDIIIDSAEFDVRSLVQFFHKKCDDRIKITLYVDTSLHLLKYESIYTSLKTKLSQGFRFVSVKKDRYSQYLIVNIGKNEFEIV